MYLVFRSFPLITWLSLELSPTIGQDGESTLVIAVLSEF